jgi:hypothetical protein
MYQSIKSQPSRLGEFADFGQAGGSDVTAAIAAVGNTIVGTTRAITESQVLKQQSRDQRKVAVHVATENTKKLGISTRGATEQAKLEVQKVKATYGSITKLVLGGGAVFASLMLAGALAYTLAKGDEGEYEYEYEYAT